MLFTGLNELSIFAIYIYIYENEEKKKKIAPPPNIVLCSPLSTGRKEAGRIYGNLTNKLRHFQGVNLNPHILSDSFQNQFSKRKNKIKNIIFFLC